MKLKWWHIPALTGMLLAVLLIRHFMINSVPVEGLAEKPGPDPGYYEQYRIMKQNEAGEIPMGLRSLWYQQDVKNYKKSGNLFDVKEWGPNHVGGRTRALLIDHSDNNHIVAGGISGGIWNSYDRGISWKQADDHAISLAASCITQNPFDADELYFGTGETQGNSAGISGEGVFKSTDNGKTFEQLKSTVNSNFNQIWDIKHSLTDSHTVYVATNATGLWRSKDGGATFTKFYNTTAPIHEIEVFSDSTIIIAIAGTGLYKINENSSAAIKLGGGIPTSGFNRITVAYCESQPKEIYAQFMGPGSTSHLSSFRSKDGGVSWTALSSPGTTISYSWAWYCLELAVHPTNPEWIASISVSPGYSVDGGKTWLELDATHADYHTLRFFKGEENFLIGNDGGIYQYNALTPGFGAQSLNNGYNVTQFYTGAFASAGFQIIGGTQDNGTWVGSNMNPRFNEVLGGDGAYCAIHPQKSNVMYASWQNGNLRRSTNSGSSWTDIDNTLQSSGDGFWFINPFEVNPANGDQVYFPTKKKIWRSLNQGTTWQSMTNNIAGNIYAVAMTPEESPTLYFGGQSSMLYRVKSAKEAVAGSEFMMTTLSPTNARGGFIGNIEINPLQKSTIYLSMNNISANPRLWKVWNADTDQPTWSNVSGNLPSMLPVNWVEVDAVDTNFIAAATDFGLYTTRDGGTTWVKEMTIPNVQIPMIKLRDTDGALFVYTHGRGVWLANTRTKNNLSVKSSNKSEMVVYPNPAKSGDIIQIKTAMPFQEVILYDLQGKEIWRTEATVFKLSEVLSGQYVLKVFFKNGQTIASKLFIQ